MAGNDNYNFCVHDKKLNEVINDNYNKIFDKIISSSSFLNSNVKNNIDELLKNDIKYNLLQPISVTETSDNYELNFEINGSSIIYGNSNNSTTNTQFKLIENKNINKNDFAYTVLYFPNYDENMIKKNDYLLSTLVVGFCLKNMNNNYHLFKQGKTGTKAKVICMTTCDIDEMTKNILLIYFDEVKIVPYIAPIDCNLPLSIKNDKNKFIPIQDVSKGNIKKSHGYYKVFTKLNIFNKSLFPYKKLILVDSDLFALGYFDTLFSLDVPAGWLEHRRPLKSHLGVSSWINDRQPFCKHGKSIPRMFTDIENDYGSDINASLFVISPNNTLFDSMIGELKTPVKLWFGNDKYHKGFWLGNRFFDYYLLPEQNYITKRLSGQWKSIDLGFCSWLLDLNESFGFTFAGFMIKPWKIQGAFHKYTINPYSEFSKLNNNMSQRSYGCQLLNNLMFSMLIDIKSKNLNYYKQIIMEIDDTLLIFDKFDPWEPEINLKTAKSTKIKNITIDELKNISYDQKKLVYLSNNTIDKNYLKKILYFDYVFDNITKNIFNLHFLTLTYKLVDILYDIAKKYNLVNTLFPFGNTLISLIMFGLFDITDDDNDFILIVKNKNVIYDIIQELLKINNIQVYICLKGHKFIRIIPNNINNTNNTNNMYFNDFKNNFDFNKMLFFNFAFNDAYVKNYISANNVNVSRNMLLNHNHNNLIKLPWVDVFFMIDNTQPNLKFYAGKDIELSRDVFFANSDSVLECINNKTFRIPSIKKYINEYYNIPDKMSYYTIKSCHGTRNRNIIFKIDIRDDLNKLILFEINSYFKNILKSLYLNFKN